MTPAERDAAVALARDLQQVEHEIRTVALVEWGWPESSPRQAAMRRWASVLRDVLDAISTRDWQPIATAEKYGPPILAYATELVDPDFNPSGSVESCWLEDTGWIGAVWDGQHDTWVTQVIHPTHWQPLPAPPTPRVTCSICRRDDCGGDHPGE